MTFEPKCHELRRLATAGWSRINQTIDDGAEFAGWLKGLPMKIPIVSLLSISQGFVNIQLDYLNGHWIPLTIVPLGFWSQCPDDRDPLPVIPNQDEAAV